MLTSATTTTVSNDRYWVCTDEEPLGVGSYATVYPVEERSMSPEPLSPFPLVAKVTYLQTENHRNAFAREKEVYVALAKSRDPWNPHIVQCVRSYVINNHGVLILEKFRGTTLEDHLNDHGPLSPADAIHCLSQIVSVMQHLHRLNIALTDLKVENIAYDAQTRTVQLFDFGLATVVFSKGVKIKRSSGTPLYMPPEMLFQEYHDPMVADSWMLGQVVFEMLVGYGMFAYCNTLSVLRSEIAQCRPLRGVARYLNAVSHIPMDLKLLVEGLCAYFPGKRWDLDRVESWLQCKIAQPHKEILEIVGMEE